VIGIVDACSVQWHLEALSDHSFVGIQIRSGPWCGCPRSVDLLLTPLSQGPLCAVWGGLLRGLRALAWGTGGDGECGGCGFWNLLMNVCVEGGFYGSPYCVCSAESACLGCLPRSDRDVRWQRVSADDWHRCVEVCGPALSEPVRSTSC
jgi:hypothetical protein